MNFDFSYDNYIRLLKHAQEFAPICQMKEFDKGRCIILRHDIDLDLGKAYDMACLEHKNNITSTFFVMLTSKNYNLFNQKARGYLYDIKRLGFEIGLHFDPTVYGKYYQHGIDTERKILSDILQKEILSISFHNVAYAGEIPTYPDLINAYNPAIFNNDIYLSDSQMDFRGKDPFSFVQRASNHSIQLLFHPIHWNHNNLSYKEILIQMFHRVVNDFDEEIREKASLYDSRFPEPLWNYIRRPYEL